MIKKISNYKKRNLDIDKKLFILIFTIMFSIFLFTSDGHRNSMDEDLTQYHVKRLVTLEPHPLFIENESRMLFEYPNWFTNSTGPVCQNPILCSPSHIGHSILYYPFVYINHEINKITKIEINLTYDDFDDPAYIIWRNSLDNDFILLETFYGPIFASLSVAIFFLISRTFTYSEKTSIFLALIFGLATAIWAYSNTSLNTTASIFFILWGFYYFRKFQQNYSLQKILLSSVILSFGFLVRPDVILVIIPLFVLLIFELKSRDKKIKKIILFLIPHIFSFAILKLIDYLNFGIFDNKTGITSVEFIKSVSIIDTPLHVGIFGNLLAPGLGLMIFVPVLFTIFFSFPDFWQKHKKETILFSSIIIIFLIFYGRLDAWHGFVSWTARYMITLIPFMLLPLGYSIEKRNSKKIIVIIGILSIIGVFFNIIYVIQDTTWFVWCTPGCGHGLYTLIGTESQYNIDQTTFWTFKNSQLTWAINTVFTNLQLDLILYKVLGATVYIVVVASTLTTLSIILLKILKKEVILSNKSKKM